MPSNIGSACSRNRNNLDRLRSIARPILIWIRKIACLAESQQWITVLRKRRGLFTSLARDARVVEDRVPYQVGNKHLQQRRPVADRIAAQIIRQPVIDPRE